MKIRKAVPRDAEQIAKVHVDCWRTTYNGIVSKDYLNDLSYDHFTKQWESNSFEQVYVAENRKGEIIGFSVGGKERSGNYESYSGELYAIYILEAYQGNGVGKMLVQAVMEGLKQTGIDSMLVWVLEKNKSKHFYEALGGVEIDSAEIEIGGDLLSEIAYGWASLKDIV